MDGDRVLRNSMRAAGGMRAAMASREGGVTSDSNPLPGPERWRALAADYPGEGGRGSATAPAVPAPAERENVWARRVSVIVLVLFCLELGLVLLVLPWTRLWVDNNLLLDHPTLRTAAANTFVRGAFSGLGLLDLWIGIWEAISYREVKPNRQ
jgi:hypothetical protein